MAEQLRFPLGRLSSRQFPPVRAVAQGARAYAASQGLRYSARGLGTKQVNPRAGFAVQKAYRQGETGPVPERTRQSYEAMRSEVNQQYEHMTRPKEHGGLGMQVEVTAHDPYPSPSAMAADVRRGRIKVMSTATTGGHAVFSDEENDRFRAVHDVFGHAGIGRGFSRHGEEAAFLSHVQMFSPAAHEALASETRGQNSYLNYGPTGEFPGNAAVPLPSWATRRTPRPPEPPARRVVSGRQMRLFRA